jgi:hypothetical protein
MAQRSSQNEPDPAETVRDEGTLDQTIPYERGEAPDDAIAQSETVSDDADAATEAGVAEDTSDAEDGGEPSFEELEQAVALREDGQYVLTLPAPPVSPLGKLARLGMLFVVGMGFLIFISYVGFWYYGKRYPFESERHQHDLEYLANQREEAKRFTPDGNKLITIPWAESVKRKYIPGTTMISEEEQMLAPRRPRVVVDYLERRWKSMIGTKVWVTRTGRNSYHIIAANKRRKMTINAQVSPEPGRAGASMVTINLRRPPDREEKLDYALPKYLPRPPQGANENVVGGGAKGTRLGRVYQYTMPLTSATVLRHYIDRFRGEGWEKMSEQYNPHHNIYSLVFRKDSMGCTLQISTLYVGGRKQTLAALTPF